MSRFGDLLAGKKAPPAPAAPAPVAVSTPPAEAIRPDLGEDTTKYEEVIEEELEEVSEEEGYESDVSLNEMTKRELEEYARTVGLELDRRHNKATLLNELEEFLSN